MNDEKKERLLAAAADIFVRHGYRRTTIGDIAEQAEVSRPAIYLEYANKEALFRAVLLRYYQKLQARAARRLRSAGTLRERLGAVLRIWSAEVYEFASGSPEGQELRLQAVSCTADVRQLGLRMFEGQVEEAIRRSTEVEAGAVDEQALNLPLLAPFIVASSRGLEQVVHGQRELERLLETLVELVVAALGATGAEPRAAASRRAG